MAKLSNGLVVIYAEEAEIDRYLRAGYLLIEEEPAPVPEKVEKPAKVEKTEPVKESEHGRISR